MIKILNFLLLSYLLCDVSVAQNISHSPDIETSEIERIIFEKINLIRLKCGLNPLKNNEKLSLAALAHSRDMVERGFFSHYNPEGEGVVERVRNAGIGDKISDDGTYYFSIAENIGYVRPGYLRQLNNIRVERTAESLALSQIKMWLKSKPHKKNILGKDYEETGIGVAVDKNDNFFAVQIFR